MIATDPGPSATPIEKEAWRSHPLHRGEPTFEDPNTGEIVDWVWDMQSFNWLPEGYQINVDRTDVEKIATA